MIIHIEICDHCDVPTRGAVLTPYKIAGEDPVFHICESCKQKPFRRVAPSPKGTSIRQVLQMALDAS